LMLEIWKIIVLYSLLTTGLLYYIDVILV
jgi:hypothetical protein